MFKAGVILSIVVLIGIAILSVVFVPDTHPKLQELPKNSVSHSQEIFDPCDLYLAYEIRKLDRQNVVEVKIPAKMVFASLYKKIKSGMSLNCAESDVAIIDEMTYMVYQSGDPAYKKVYENEVLRNYLLQAVKMEIKTAIYSFRSGKLNRTTLMLLIQHFEASPWNFKNEEIGVSNKLEKELFPIR